MSQELAIALVAVIAPFLVQFFRWVLNRFGVSLKGIPALVVAGLASLLLALVASLVSGEFDLSPEGIGLVFALSHTVYVLFRDKLADWMPAE